MDSLSGLVSRGELIVLTRLSFGSFSPPRLFSLDGVLGLGGVASCPLGLLETRPNSSEVLGRVLLGEVLFRTRENKLGIEIEGFCKYGIRQFVDVCCRDDGDDGRDFSNDDGDGDEEDEWNNEDGKSFRG